MMALKPNLLDRELSLSYTTDWNVMPKHNLKLNILHYWHICNLQFKIPGAEALDSTKDERAHLLELVADQYAMVSQLL
jgi:hypothetical protein